MRRVEILNKHNFKFNKAYGQNFIFDTNFLQSIIDKIDISDKTVLEIGPGAGTLTAMICKSAKKVVAVEIDNNLMTKLDGLYVIGDGSGVTHSLSHASASGIYAARDILLKI